MKIFIMEFRAIVDVKFEAKIDLLPL